MSSNRQKTSKRLSLRKKGSTKIAKSPRRSQPSLGHMNHINHNPLPFALNSNSNSNSNSHSPKSKSPIQTISRSKSTINISSHNSHNPAIQNIIGNQTYTSIKPKINKNWPSPNFSNPPPQSQSQPHNMNNISLNEHTDNDNYSDADVFETASVPPPNVYHDNLSPASSISDMLFGTMATTLHEDSDEAIEAATKQMFSRINNHLNLSHKPNNNNNCKHKLRKIQSTPAISSMISINNINDRDTHSENTQIASQRLYFFPNQRRNSNPPPMRMENNINTSINIVKCEDNTSPSSVSTNNTDKDAMCTITNRYRSASVSSNQSDDTTPSMNSINSSSFIKSVPEGNAIIKTEDGLMTYISQDTHCVNYEINNNNNNNTQLPRVKSVNAINKTTHTNSHSHTHRMLCSLSNKGDKKRRMKKKKNDKKRQRIGCQQSNSERAFVRQKLNHNNQNMNQNHITYNKQKTNGLLDEIPLQSEWDCLTVSDNKWVALFSRNSMALLRINEYGKFEQLRDLKAGRKESRLKYGAVDAQFYYDNPNKLISCTRSGTLIVLNLNLKGRGCVVLTNCKLKQRVHKVTWIKNTQNVLAAAEDGKCYLWDTRIEGGCGVNGHFIGGKSFSIPHKSSALSCKISPFNDRLFASSHKNGTLNVWDIRNEKCPFLTIQAHTSSISCVDWHPAIPNVMASCGYRDITIKIWNLTDDKIAQSKYFSFWNQYQHSHRYYNCEDDYRLSSEMIHSPSHTTNGYVAVSVLQPNYSMYPCGHISQIGWRPCTDPKSLSANQIACAYVGGEQQVVEMWDIKSSYVPVARMSSHESETKFKFIFKNKPFKDYRFNDMIEESEQERNNYNDEIKESDEEVNVNGNGSNNMRTYLITCSKDKSTKLTDCGYADIPRSHLSSCALDIAPFGNTCFVSVPRQKLHPFDQETYLKKNMGVVPKIEPIVMVKSCSMGELTKNSIDMFEIENENENENENNLLTIPKSDKILKSKKRRSYSGNINNFGKDLNKLNPKKRSMTNSNVIVSDSECVPTPKKKVTSPLRSGIFGIFKNKKNKIKDNENKVNENENENGNKNENKNIQNSEVEINAMSNGFNINKLNTLTDIFHHHFDAFSEFETKLTCYQLSELSDMNSISPCDSAPYFKYLARNYKLTGHDIHILCQQNAKVAENIANYELKSLWNLLAELLKNIPQPQNIPQQNNNVNNTTDQQSPSTPKICKLIENNNINDIVDYMDNDSDMELQLDDDENDNNDWWMHPEPENNNNNNNNNEEEEANNYPSSASNSYLSLNSIASNQNNNNIIYNTPPLKTLQHAFENGNNSAMANNNNNNNILISDNEMEDDTILICGYICDVLNENISRGDIQTAVSIIIILSQYINRYLDEDYICDIILSYLDLLLHSKLLIEAVKIYELTKHYAAIEEYFLCKHRLIIKCIRCKETMRNHRCFKCNKISKCNICNEPLLLQHHPNTFYGDRNNKLKHPKLLIWCQICGHGGHFDHMKNWFVNKSICSCDNCTHICQPVLISCHSK